MTSILLCLHGWGGSKESFTELRAALEGSGIKILTPDLPGFGAEPEPNRPWTNDDYADWIEDWLRKQQSIFNFQCSIFNLLGHSHGGRIAIKLASRQSRTRNQKPETNNHRIDHLFLLAAAGIPHPPTTKEYLGLIAAKTGGVLLSIPGFRWMQPLARKTLYRILGVHDYERASPLMKETLKLVTDEDLTPLLSSITMPTDIFWGTADTMTPLSDALIMQRGIVGSTLHTFEGKRHRIHRDCAGQIAEVIRARIPT